MAGPEFRSAPFVVNGAATGGNLMKSPIELAIAHMRESYSEPLSLADIARSAMLSRFHFSRVFREATGISPGRFLSAVRIYEAKRMLASTSLSVTDISLAVGYNSLGSFTNRFTESVGLSPSRFRRLWHTRVRGAPEPSPSRQAALPESAPQGAVAGRVELPSRYAAAWVYLGAFATPIVQRRPSASVILQAWPDRPASYRLAGIPAGEWYILAVAVADSADPEPWTRRSLLVGGQGSSVTVTPGAVRPAVLTLRPRRPTDLPILFAVPDLEPDGARYEHRLDPAQPVPEPAAACRSPRRGSAPVAWSDRRRA